MLSATFHWTEVKARWLGVVQQGTWPTQRVAFERRTAEWASSVREGAGTQRQGWEGQTAADTTRYIQEGFKSPLFTVHEINPPQPRRRKRARWSEDDGDADAGRLLGGCDEFYLTRGDSETRPGLTLEIVLAFAGGVDSSILARYGAWNASLIAGLEAEGYDLEVAITVPTASGQFQEQSRTPSTTRIIVKRPGEVSDFSAWSVLFSPGGFRHLCFVAIGMAGDLHGLTVTRGLGSPDTRTWGVERDGYTITVHCDPRGKGQCEQELNAAANAAGILGGGEQR